MRFLTIRRALIEARHFRDTYGERGVTYRAQREGESFAVAVISKRSGVFLTYL